MDIFLNWLWQGCLIALATTAGLRVLQPMAARLRYVVWWAALLSTLSLPIIPIASLALWPEAPVAAGALESIVPVVSIPQSPWTTSTLPLVLWSLWVAVGSSRLAVALVALRRATAASQPIAPAWETRLHHWVLVNALASTTARGTPSIADRHGRRTRIVLSDRVRAAAVLGFRSPVIALAPALLNRLTDDELDRVVIHEWAHVQRRDDVAHLVQQLALVVAGWHPAVRWIDRQLHIEQEVSCDEIAADMTGSRKAYAACLAKLATTPLSRLAPWPVPGALFSSSVRTRIIRLLETRGEATRRSVFAAIVASAALLAVASIVGHVKVVVPDVAAIGLPVDLGRGTALVSLRPALDLTASAPSTVPLRPRRTQPSRTTRGSVGPILPALPALSERERVEGSERERVEGQRRADRVVAMSDGDEKVDAQETLLHADVFAPPDTITEQPIPSTGVLIGSALQTVAVVPSPQAEPKPQSPWGAAADAGVAIGRGSQNAAVATAGFFSRLGKKIAGSF